MSVEEELAAITGMDQTGAAMKNMADMIAVFWLTLRKSGLPQESATELSLPLVIKMLGGNPE